MIFVEGSVLSKQLPPFALEGEQGPAVLFVEAPRRISSTYGGQVFDEECQDACRKVGGYPQNPFLHDDFKGEFPAAPASAHYAIRNTDGTWSDRTIFQNMGVYATGDGAEGFHPSFRRIIKADTFAQDVYLKFLEYLYSLDKFRVDGSTIIKEDPMKWPSGSLE